MTRVHNIIKMLRSGLPSPSAVRNLPNILTLKTVAVRQREESLKATVYLPPPIS